MGTNKQELMAIHQSACRTLDEKVSAFYQKYGEHMQCKRGCSACCENALFRIRLVEAQAIWEAYQNAPIGTQTAILNNIAAPKEGHENDCPILIDGACSLYQARPALCRAYGSLIRLNGDISTCKLNFNEAPKKAALEVLEIEPFYDLLDELSQRIWAASPSAGQSSAPLFSIREFFTGKLAKTSPNTELPGQTVTESACNRHS